MKNVAKSPCDQVRVIAFRGKRDRAFRALRDQAESSGTGPSPLECLIFAGHTGVQLVDQGEIVGFHPAISTIRSCDAFEALTKGDAFPGIVSDDTQLFHLAESQFMLPLQTISIRMPRSDYDRFVSLLDAERVAGKYSYGFPNGDGDCNCTTWLERLGLPLLTCHMEEFVSMRGFAVHAVRRFGACS